MLRIFFLALAFALASNAGAQAYPSKTVTLLVSSAPGGPGDVLARALLQPLHDHFRETFIVDNRGGAGGSIAAGMLARAAPNGYTLLITVDAPIVVNPALYDKLPYESPKDFQPVVMLGDGGDVALAVPASSTAKTVPELVEQMKRDPGKANYVSSGIGFPSHIISELFKRDRKFDAVHFPAKGAGNAMAEFLSGRMNFYFPPVSLAVPQLNAGKIRVLGVAASKRNPLLPDVPTLAELGYPGVTPQPYWMTIFAPAGTPRAIVDTLAAEIRRITKTPQYRRILQIQGLVPSDLTPDELTMRVRNDLAYWTKTIKLLGIKAD